MKDGQKDVSYGCNKEGTILKGNGGDGYPGHSFENKNILESEHVNESTTLVA